MLDNERNKKFISISDDGGVILKFRSERQKNRKLKNDEGLKLLNDLVNAKYTIDEQIQDAKILYQTEGPFDFNGYKEETTNPIPTSFPEIADGVDIFSEDEQGHLENIPPFAYNTSITSYGNDTQGNMQYTLLPKQGFQGQVAIAPGTPTIFIGERKVDRFVGDKRETGSEPVFITSRKELVKHELRENLNRTQKGNGYLTAHSDSYKEYFPKWDTRKIGMAHFIWGL